MGKSNIVLIGMPGSGKSTVGVLLAKVLGYDFVDTDLLIQIREGSTLEEIIREKGVDTFLDIEGEVCSSLAAEKTVVATGGSVIYRSRAVERLSARGEKAGCQSAGQPDRRRGVFYADHAQKRQRGVVGQGGRR